METEIIKQKREFILSIINNFSSHFPLRLTDCSKKDWVDELMIYSEDRIIKAKKLLISSHRGFLHIADFHEAISNFPKEKQMIDEPVRKSVPMPKEFKEKYMKLKRSWDK